MKILVTGSGGQLGRAISACIQSSPAGRDTEMINTEAGATATALNLPMLDITDIDHVTKIVRETAPDVIINCAAYTAVDKQEKDEDTAYRINAVGPRNLAIAATEIGARLVHVSTDYVFDGKGTRPYIEFDPTGPVSVYGRTKLAGEQFVRDFSNRFFILRTAWLYGNGNNFLRTMLKLSETHDVLNVVEDQLGTPTTAKELAKAILSLYNTDNYGIFHATCEGSCSWADFAEKIFEKTGKKTKVTRVTSARYKELNPQSADRPAYSILDNYMFRLTNGYLFADWEQALDEYIREDLK